MAGDRIDIEVVDKINAGIAKKLERIALGADNADESLKGLKNTIKTAEGGSLRLAQAQNALSGAQIRMRAASERLNVIKKKGSATSLQLAAAENRLSAAQLRVRAASERVTMTIKKDAIAKEVAAAKTARLTSATNRMAVSQNRARAATRGLNTDLGMMLRTGLAFAGAGFGIRQIVGLGESYTMLQNKMKNVTETSGQLESVSKNVFDVARKTRSPIMETAQAFQRFDLALMQLGASQSESLRLTETVNKQLINSGAATSEQASALLQLSQAFNKGKLDGDEFRSVMELMPPVADAIARQLKVTRGELLNLAPEGKITAEVMRNALANAASEVDSKFSKMTATMGQGVAFAKNNFIEFFGSIDKSLGITSGIAKAIMGITKNMELLGVAALTTGALIATGMAMAFGPSAIAGISKFFTLFLSNPWGIAIVGMTAIIGLLATFKDEIKVSSDGMITLGDVFKTVYDYIAEATGAITSYVAEAWRWAYGEEKKEIEATSAYFNDSIDVKRQNMNVFSKFLIGAYKGMVRFIGDAINTSVRFWVSAYEIITALWDNFPKAIGDIFGVVVNAILGRVEGMVNGVIGAINGLLDYINKANALLGEYGFNSMKKAVKPIEFRLDLSAFKRDASDLSKTLDAIAKKDYAGDFASDITEGFSNRLRQNALNRIQAPEYGTTESAPSRGKPQVSAPGGKGSAGAINNKTQRKEKFYLDTALVDGFQNKEFQKIFDETHGSMMQIHDAALATDAAFESGMIGLENYSMRMADLTAETAQLKLEMGDATFFDIMMGSLDMVRDGFQNVATSISQSFGGLFKTLSDGFADSLGKAIVYGDDLATSLRDVAKSAMAELISSIVKMGIQWVVTTVMQAAASKGALAATTAAGVAAASASASAWAPAAAMASLASYGANAAPATAGIAGTSAFARSMAVLPGFESGGYTGDMESNKVAGLVHGKEFVMNAETVRRVGVNNLEAIQRGGENNSTASFAGGSESPGGSSKNETNIYNIIDPDLVVDALNSSQGTEAVLNIISNNPEFIGGL